MYQVWSFILILDTQYDVVKFVGKKLFKWILQYEPDANNWDMFWTDAAVQPETLGKMQRIFINKS